MSELIEKLERNARTYEAEAAQSKPADARNLGPEECKAIAGLLREAVAAIKQQEATA